MLHAEQAVAREPQNAERFFLQALVLERAGREEPAQRALQRCLALDPRQIKAYVNLDASYLRCGNLQASRALAGLAIREMERSGGAFAFWRHPLQRPPHVHPVRTAQNTKRHNEDASMLTPAACAGPHGAAVVGHTRIPVDGDARGTRRHHSRGAASAGAAHRCWQQVRA